VTLTRTPRQYLTPVTIADRVGDERLVGGTAYQTKSVGLGRRPAVLVVDMAASVADHEVPGSLPAAVEAVVPTRRLLDAARLGSVPVFFTLGGKRWFTATSADLTDDERGSWPWKAGQLAGGHGPVEATMQLASALDRQPGETIVSKTAPSAFFDSPLGSMLRRRQVDSLLVAGVHTTGCVLATVIDAFSHGFRVSVVTECVADSDVRASSTVLDLLARKYADVIRLAPTLAELSRHSSARGRQVS
jgi:maleamate amidohydrolase